MVRIVLCSILGCNLFFGASVLGDDKKLSKQVGILVKQLQSGTQENYYETIVALGEMGPRAIGAAPALLSLLEIDDVFLYQLVTEALGNMGVQVVPLLLTAMTHKNMHVRMGATVALGNIGIPAVTAHPRLIKKLLVLLKDEKSEVCDVAIQVLGEMGPRAAPSVKALVGLLGDVNLHVEVAKTLGAIGKVAIPDLLVALRDRDSVVRLGAVRALSCMGPTINTKDVIRYLLVMSRTDTKIPGQALAQAFSKMGQAVIPYLKIAVKSTQTRQKLIAIEALGLLGKASVSEVPLLVTCLKDSDVKVQNAASSALRKMGYWAAAPVVACLKRSDLDEQEVLWVALRSIGRPVLPMLRKLLVDTEKYPDISPAEISRVIASIRGN